MFDPLEVIQVLDSIKSVIVLFGMLSSLQFDWLSSHLISYAGLNHICCDSLRLGVYFSLQSVCVSLIS